MYRTRVFFSMNLSLVVLIYALLIAFFLAEDFVKSFVFFFTIILISKHNINRYFLINLLNQDRFQDLADLIKI